jgi:hypothetical protein
MSAKRSAGSRLKGKKRKPVVSGGIKAGPERDLQKVFSSYQQEFHAALDKSAEMLSQALSKPPPSDFVERAYNQAMEMFSEIERASLQARTGSYLPRIDMPTLERGSGSAAADALAASALMMSRATEHLNAAMESVLQKIDHSLNLPTVEVSPQDLEREQKRPS